MKKLFYILAVATLAAGVVACQKVKEEDAFSKAPVAPELYAHGDILITNNTLEEDVIFSWSSYRFLPENLDYTLYATYGDNDPVALYVTKEQYYSTTKKDFRDLLFQKVTGLLAEKFVYGFEKVEAVSPFIIDARRGEGVEITFGGDYLLLNLTTGFGPDDSGFEVAGDDGKFYPAEANVDFDGKTILLSCPLVEFPSKVRYAFFSYGPTPLHAQNGLTATPFQVRIDKDLGGA